MNSALHACAPSLTVCLLMILIKNCDESPLHVQLPKETRFLRNYIFINTGIKMDISSDQGSFNTIITPRVRFS